MTDRDADFLIEGMRVLSQALMEMEVGGYVGAAHHERGAARGRAQRLARAIPGS